MLAINKVGYKEYASKILHKHPFAPARGGKHGLPHTMIDIREYPEVIEIINGILNNGGVAEVKNEKRRREDNIVVVETMRVLRTKKPRM